MENEDKNREAAERLAKATFEQCKLQIESDLAMLRCKLPPKRSQAVETALDMKYVQQRQQ